MAIVHILKNWILKLYKVSFCLLSSFWSGLRFGPDEKQVVLDWVANFVTQPPSDLTESWRNGILLCELADKFFQDSFQGLGILDPKNCVSNVSLALEIMKGSLEIELDVTPEDIVTCAPEAEAKLLHLLLKLKQKVESRETEEDESSRETSSEDEEPLDLIENDSFAQGTGLVIGFLGHKGSFIVFSNGLPSDLDIVIEIKGPFDTYCCERITKRSPKLKSVLPGMTSARPTVAHRKRSQSEGEEWTVDETEKKDPKMIPLEYEIKDDLVSVGYIPIKKGPHTISVLWQGLHVTGSPFQAEIEDSFEPHKSRNTVLRPPILRKETSQTTQGFKKPSVRFREPDSSEIRLGKVRSRRVLRYIIKIDKKDVIVEAESPEMIAPALRKLDSAEGGTVLGPRRNSWGFVGDVNSQSRLSLFRQLCIDDDEEVQERLQKRSSSINVPFSACAARSIRDESGTEFCAYPPTSPNDQHPSASNDGEVCSVNVSRLQNADLRSEKHTSFTKFRKLETVREGEAQFWSLSSSMSTENEDKVSSSEDEVFYRETSAPISECPAMMSSMAAQNTRAKDTAEILGEANNLNAYQKRKADQVTDPRHITNDGTEAQSHAFQNGRTGCKSLDLEIYSDSTKTEENALDEDETDSKFDGVPLRNKRETYQDNISQPAFLKFGLIDNQIPSVENHASEFHSDDKILSFDSGNNTSSVSSFGSPADSQIEIGKSFNSLSTNLLDKTETTGFFPVKPLSYFYSTIEYLTTTDEEQTRMDQEDPSNDKYHSPKENAQYCITEHKTSSLQHQNVPTRNIPPLQHENTKELALGGAAEIIEKCQYNSEHYSACNYEYNSAKDTVCDPNISATDCNAHGGIISVKSQEEHDTDISCKYFDHCKNWNFLAKVQSNDLQVFRDGGVFLNGSENLNPCDEHACDHSLLSHDDILRNTKPSNTRAVVPSCGKMFSNGKETTIHNIELAIKGEDIQEIFQGSATTQAETSLKHSKTKCIFPHPYLRTIRHRTKNCDLKKVPPSSDIEGQNAEVAGERESFSLSETRRHFENGCSVGDDTESQKRASDFSWPTKFLGVNKHCILESEQLSTSAEHRPEINDEKNNKISNPTEESLKFSLRSYKDKHLSAREELVPQNSVRAIIKDFHEKAVKYPAGSAVRASDIYLRRSFFPPLAANQDRKTVKSHVSKWEKSTPVSPEPENFTSESSFRDNLSLYVSVQSKVAFWENAYRSTESAGVGGEITEEETSSFRAAAVHTDKSIFRTLEDISMDDVQPQDYSGFDSGPDSDNMLSWKEPPRESSRPVTSQQTDDSGISDDLLVCLKTSDHRREPVPLHLRSMSDPCIRTCSTGTADFLSNLEEHLNIIPSSPYCTSDKTSEEANSECDDANDEYIDDEIASVTNSECDDANDEYIDDEIPDYAAMFLGDYISFTGLLGPERSPLREEAVTQYLEKLEDKSRHIFDPSLSRPHECRALGVGIHYGSVSINNHFQVLTAGAGRGNLSVSIQGSGRHDVIKIIVTYGRNDVYDVIYQVLEPGYYIISVRWSDWSIPGSPFICKVTY